MLAKTKTHSFIDNLTVEVDDAVPSPTEVLVITGAVGRLDGVTT